MFRMTPLIIALGGTLLLAGCASSATGWSPRPRCAMLPASRLLVRLQARRYRQPLGPASVGGKRLPTRNWMR